MSGSSRGIWIQGAGELASGVALRLTRCGYAVIAAEISNPLAVRRLVSFSEAVYEGRVEIEGVKGVLAPLEEADFCPGEVTVLVDPEASRLSNLAHVAVIDARMTKRIPEPLPRGTIPLIGLGPGFHAGDIRLDQWPRHLEGGFLEPERRLVALGELVWFCHPLLVISVGRVVDLHHPRRFPLGRHVFELLDLLLEPGAAAQGRSEGSQ